MFRRILILSCVFMGVLGSARAEVLPPPPPSAAASSLLLLEGKPVGFMKSVAGGAIFAPVVSTQVGSGTPPKKHLGAVAYEEFALLASPLTGKGLIDWITRSMDGRGDRKSGEVISCDFNMNAKDSREFAGALLTEVEFPDMDGASRDAGFLTVRFQPEQIRVPKTPASKCESDSAPSRKQWMRNGFRLELPGVDSARVSKIDSFTIKMGQRLAISNLRVTVSETGIESWLAWFDEFVVQGRNDDSHEKAGAIVLLGNTLEELGRVQLTGVGISSLVPEPTISGADRLRRWTAELYVERMELKLK